MRHLFSVCACVLFSWFILQTEGQAALWTLQSTSTDGFATSNWACSGAGFACGTYPTPNAAQTVPGINLPNSYVKFPVCGTGVNITFNTLNGGTVRWPTVRTIADGSCPQVNISGPQPTFSVYNVPFGGNFPSVVLESPSENVLIEQQVEGMIIPSLTGSAAKSITIQASSIQVNQFSYVGLRPAIFFQGTSGKTSSVEVKNTAVTYTNSLFAKTSNWTVNCDSGISLTESFSVVNSVAASTFAVNIWGANGVATRFKVTANSMTLNRAKLNLLGMTNIVNVFNRTDVAFSNSAELILSGLWSFDSGTSFDGAGVLDLVGVTSPTTLPGAHVNHTVRLSAGHNVQATGSFSLMSFTSSGAFSIDRNNVEGVVDLVTLQGTSVTLKNGKFHVYQVDTLVMESAEVTVTGSVVTSTGDANSVLILESPSLGKLGPTNTDGQVRFRTHPCTIYSDSTIAALFIESQAEINTRLATLPGPTVIDNALLYLDMAFTFSVPITVRNNGVLRFNTGAVLDISNTQVTLESGGQVENHIDFAPASSCAFGTKGENLGRFVNFGSLTIAGVTFETDNLVLEENTVLVVESSGVVSATSLYSAPNAAIQFIGAIELTGDFVNDGHLYLGGESAVGQSSLVGNFAQNGNGTTYLTFNHVNDTQSFGEYDTLNVTGDVILFGTLRLNFSDVDAALNLPDQAWYPVITLTGASGGIFDRIEHNLGAEVEIKICFTATQGILVLSHNTTSSALEFEPLLAGCDYDNPVPVSAPLADPAAPVDLVPGAPTVSSAVTAVVSNVAVLAALALAAVYLY